MSTTEPVTVTVARRVVPGSEPVLGDWAREALQTAGRFRGFLGGGMLRPSTARCWSSPPSRG